MVSDQQVRRLFRLIQQDEISSMAAAGAWRNLNGGWFRHVWSRQEPTNDDVYSATLTIA